MLIRRVELNNFRQFYGRQFLDLSTDRAKTITLVHAENGLGKTTILNALLWSMFGDFTERFEEKERLVNFDAEQEGTKRASVTVEFEFSEHDWSVSRSWNRETRQPKFEAAKVVNGVRNLLDAPESFVKSVVPQSMSRYFFFDGEHAERFAAAGNRKAIARALGDILGFDLADQTAEDLVEACKEFRRKLKLLPDADRLQAIEIEIERLETEVAAVQAAKEDKEKQREIEQNTLRTLEAILRDHAATAELQKQREKLEQEIKDEQANIKRNLQDRCRWLAKFAPALVAGKLSAESLDFVTAESTRGRIPKPYNEDFVKGLLESKTCVCHRPLVDGSPEWQHVIRLLNEASSANTLGLVVRARTRANAFQERAAAARGELKAIDDREAQCRRRLAAAEQRLTEVAAKLRLAPTDLAEREAARERCRARISTLDRDIGGLVSQVGRLAPQIVEKKNELLRQARDNERARAIAAQVSLSEALKAALEAELTQYRSDARGTIEARINKVLERVARRDYVFQFSDDFTMDLKYSETGAVVPRSGGENQLISLLFTAALIEFAGQRADDKSLLLTPGTVAPLVLDAPFSSLDPRYRVSVAQFLPEMAQQVLLLLRSDQAPPDVLEALEPYVGAEYVLVAHNRGPRGERPQEFRNFHGKDYELTLYDQLVNKTELMRIR